MSLQDAATAMGGELLGDDRIFTGVSTDTRTLQAGELFVALKGETFDGHDMCAQAMNKGAAASVVARKLQLDGAQIIVTDTRASLGHLARSWRDKLDVKIVGVTGSNGKTTVKEMLASILGRVAPVLATRGNFNNDIGLPKTLFELGLEHRFAVLEMGASHLGEIAELAAIAEPDVAVVTLCAPAHLEGFGSIEGVAQTKGELFSSLPSHGVAIINADDQFFDFWQGLVGARKKISFGIENTSADVYASDIRSNGLGAGMAFELNYLDQTTEATIPHDGIHNVMNALAASAAAFALQCEISDVVDGLANSMVVSGRLNIHQLDARTKLIDDTYNANPASLLAAARVAAGSGDDTWVVLGDMGELGPDSRAIHARCGSDLRDLKITRLFTYGDLAVAASEAFGKENLNFSDKAALSRSLHSGLASRNERSLTILVKGSRAMRMETVVRDLLQLGEIAC